MFATSRIIPLPNLPSLLCMQYHKLFIMLGALFAMTAVMLGAFGAHVLKGYLSAEDLAGFKTGVSYQFYHALGLIAMGIIRRRWTTTRIKWAGLLMVAGVVFFSGSLYALTLAELAGVQRLISVLGPITPLGGLCFILSWGLLLLESLHNHR